MMSIIYQWDIARFLIGALIVACAVGVWRGFRLEQSDVEGDRNAGRKLLVGGLTLQFCLALVLLVVDTVGSVHERRALLALNAEIAPRRLTPEKQQSISTALTAFSGKNVQLVSYGLDVEAAVLGRQLREALEGAGLGVGDALMTRASNGSVEFGVHVVGRNADLVRALIVALLKADIDAARGDDPPGGGSTDTQAAGVAIVDASVLIGVKPITR